MTRSQTKALNLIMRSARRYMFELPCECMIANGEMPACRSGCVMKKEQKKIKEALRITKDMMMRSGQ